MQILIISICVKIIFAIELNAFILVPFKSPLTYFEQEQYIAKITTEYGDKDL